MHQRAHSVQIERITFIDEVALANLFEELASDADTTRFFHPHPLTREYAAWLCGSNGPRLDRYYLARRGGKTVGYSMLRGWDEGYSVPAFGACVRPSERSAGLGQTLVAHAVEEARIAGARRLRLTVYRSNRRALHIYAKFGFIFEDKNPQELIGWVSLAPVQWSATG